MDDISDTTDDTAITLSDIIDCSYYINTLLYSAHYYTIIPSYHQYNVVPIMMSCNKHHHNTVIPPISYRQYHTTDIIPRVLYHDINLQHQSTTSIHVHSTDNGAVHYYHPITLS